MSTDAMHASVTSLTYVQLANAMAASAAEQETRMARFLAAADDAHAAAAGGKTDVAERRAEMDGAWVEYKAQAAMTRAIADEISRRIKDRNYA